MSSGRPYALEPLLLANAGRRIEAPVAEELWRLPFKRMSDTLQYPASDDEPGREGPEAGKMEEGHEQYERDHNQSVPIVWQRQLTGCSWLSGY